MPLSIWSPGWNVDKSRMNTWMSAQHGWTPRILGSELPVGITTATTTIINPIILNHNLGRAFPVGTNTSTRRVELWSKLTGTSFSWSGYWDLDNWRMVQGYRFSFRWTLSEPAGNLEKQINRMLIDASVLGWLCGGVCREDVGVVQIRRRSWQRHSWLLRPSHKGFYHYPLGCRCTFFCTEKFPPLDCLQGFYSCVSPPDKFSLCKPYVCTVKGEGLFQLVLAEWKTCYGHSDGFQGWSIDFLSMDIGFSDEKAFCKRGASRWLRLYS